MLRAEEYALMRGRAPGPASTARRAALRACPYWGVCRTLRRSVEELRRLLDRLQAEGYTTTVDISLDNGSFYPAPRLTPRGQAQLATGERLGW